MRAQMSNFDDFLYAVSYDDHLHPLGIARCDVDSMSVECMGADGSWVAHPNIRRAAPHIGSTGGLVLTDRAFIPVTPNSARHVIEELVQLTNV